MFVTGMRVFRAVVDTRTIASHAGGPWEKFRDRVGALKLENYGTESHNRKQNAET